jgi:excinuclease ABC subunit C
LEQINGIGKKSVEALLKNFKAVKHIQDASEETLSTVVGANRARKVYEYFHPSETASAQSTSEKG